MRNHICFENTREFILLKAYFSYKTYLSQILEIYNCISSEIFIVAHQILCFWVEEHDYVIISMLEGH